MYRHRGVTFNISGRAWDVIAASTLYGDPASYAAGDRNVAEASTSLRQADGRVCGRGRTYEVNTSPAAAKVIQEYCQTTGDSKIASGGGGKDLAVKLDGDALLVVADRIYWRLRELS